MARVHGIPQLESRLEHVAAGTPSAVLRQWQTRTIELAKIAAPKQTGNLKRSIRPGEMSVLKASVIAATNYAVYVEMGTKPHDIRPVHARVLAWGGARRLTGSLRSGARPDHFAMYVHHPGTRPRPFLKPSAEKAQMETGVDAVIRQWNEGA